MHLTTMDILVRIALGFWPVAVAVGFATRRSGGLFLIPLSILICLPAAVYFAGESVPEPLALAAMAVGGVAALVWLVRIFRSPATPSRTPSRL